MTEPYIGEIRLVGFNFPPRGWAQCDGELLAIDQNQTLYSILGTTFGGDGRTTFQLPDLRGRVPIHQSSSYSPGTQEGEESHSLTADEIPSHTHTIRAVNVPSDIATDPRSNDPTGNLWATSVQNHYHAYGASSSTTMASGILSASSGGQGRDVMQPFLAVNFCIALTGTFPPRN
ncbi:MAG: phage tail protein [Symploca sp. SIO2D2]|nr:phage tail protein [Symploca sp. SIO2D2]